MATPEVRIRVALNGYGVIGKRVADAIASQEDNQRWEESAHERAVSTMSTFKPPE